MERRTVIEILLAVFVAFLLLVVIPTYRVSERDYRENSDRVLREQKEYYEARIRQLQDSFVVEKQRVVELEQALEELKINYNDLQEKYVEKIASIKHYGHAELEQFFSDRYN